MLDKILTLLTLCSSLGLSVSSVRAATIRSSHDQPTYAYSEPVQDITISAPFIFYSQDSDSMTFNTAQFSAVECNFTFDYAQTTTPTSVTSKVTFKYFDVVYSHSGQAGTYEQRVSMDDFAPDSLGNHTLDNALITWTLNVTNPEDWDESTIGAVDLYINFTFSDITYNFTNSFEIDFYDIEYDFSLTWSASIQNINLGNAFKTYTQGYNDGYAFGSDNGYANGYSDGYRIGHLDGYHDGNIDGANGTIDFLGLFGAIADTPVIIIRNLFGFSIFGTPALAIFMSLITGIIVIHFVRKFI